MTWSRSRPQLSPRRPPRIGIKGDGRLREVYRRGINAKNQHQWKDAATLFQQALQLPEHRYGQADRCCWLRQHRAVCAALTISGSL